MRLGELPALCARRYPHKNATIWKDQAQIFAVFNDRVNRFVGTLADLGLRPGSKLSAQPQPVPTGR